MHLHHQAAEDACRVRSVACCIHQQNGHKSAATLVSVHASALKLMQLPWQVVACFKGRGLVAGAAGVNQESREVDGRLWLYDTGDLGFVWLDDIQCVPFADALC